MKFEWFDINDFDKHADPKAVAELEKALTQLDVYVKPSGQEGRDKFLVFDPIGTNKALAALLDKKGWVKFPIPTQFKAFGKDVDFAKNGLLAEAQFSNYPFFANNVLRSELLYRQPSPPADQRVTSVLIITKGVIFDSAQSTLYYEQAVKQLQLLGTQRIIQIPVRVIGLMGEAGVNLRAVQTLYSKSQSRTTAKEQPGFCRIELASRAQSRRGKLVWV
jgi:hypothetical protein